MTILPCFFPFAADSHLVVDEEFTAQDEEEDDACYYIRGIFIQVKLGAICPAPFCMNTRKNDTRTMANALNLLSRIQ